MLLAALLIGSPDAVYLRHSASVEVLPDSTFIEISEEWIVPLTASGVDRYSTLTVPYQLGFDDVIVERAEMRPARPGRPAATAEVAEGPREGMARASRLESSFRQLEVRFPGPETGDTLVIRTVRTVSRLPLAPCYSYSFYFQSSDSIDQSSFTAVWPAGSMLYILPSGCPQPEVSISGGTATYSWDSGPMPPAGSGAFLPPVLERASHVTISNRDAREVSAMLWRELDPGGGSPGDTAVLDSVLTAAGSTPEELRRWVASEIEYLGADIGDDPGFSPSPPVETLSRRSGVCRDSAVLLLALLRRAGFDAGLCLLRGGARLDSLPGSRSFDHMIVYVDGPGGRSLLDPTARVATAPYGSSLRGSNCLPLEEDGCGLLEIPVSPCGDTVRIAMEGETGPSMDTLTCELRLEVRGAAEELWRSMMIQVDPGARSEALRLLLGCLPGSDLRLTGDPLDLDAPVEVAGRAVYRLANLALDGVTAVRAPGLSEIDQAGTRLAAMLLSSRPADGGLVIDTPLLEILDLEITFPGWSISGIPGPVSGNGYCFSASSGGRTLEIHEQALLGPARTGAGEAGILIETLWSRSSMDRRIVLATGAGP